MIDYRWTHMKAFTSTEYREILMKIIYSSMTTVRIIIAFMFFAGGIALSEPLRSDTQYDAELRTKQESLGYIKEDTGTITQAITQAFTRIIDADRFTAHEIAAFVPSASKPQINMHASLSGTLSTQGTTGVVDRGIEEKNN